MFVHECRYCGKTIEIIDRPEDSPKAVCYTCSKLADVIEKMVKDGFVKL